MLDLLQRGGTELILFVARNPPLCHFAARWLCARVASSKRAGLLSRLHVLFEPLASGPRACCLVEGRRIEMRAAPAVSSGGGGGGGGGGSNGDSSAVKPDGLVFTGSWDASVAVWRQGAADADADRAVSNDCDRPQSHTLVQRLKGHSDAVWRLARVPENRAHLLSGSWDGPALVVRCGAVYSGAPQACMLIPVHR